MRTLKRGVVGFSVAIAVGLFATAQVGAAADLVGYWNFDEATGATLSDSSPNHNDATMIGSGVTHSTLLPPTSCFINTHSLQFDGSGSDAEITDNSSMDPTSQISISFWMRPDNVDPGYHHIIFKQGPVVTSYGVWLTDDHIYMEDNDNSVRSLTSNGTVTPGVWHYVTVTYDGLTQSLYIDGALDNSQSLPGITLTYTNSPVKIGTGDYNSPFSGYLDDLRIYNRALTAGEVAELAGGGCGPGVVSNTVIPPASNPSTQQVADQSANTLTATGTDIAASSILAGIMLVVATIVNRRRTNS